MNDAVFTALSIAAIALTTWLCRAFPFIIFSGKRKIPETITYLGGVLPAAIMIILVIYCLRDVDLLNYPHGLAEIVSIAVIVFLQWKKGNTILTIVVGTVLYMTLIRTVFPI